MTTALGIVAFFFILTFLVFIHELGHFSVARILGVRVEEFGLGFPPRLKGWRRNGILYSINAIPLGGFVKMLGENGRQDDPEAFGSKAPWKRFLVLVAGPAMNIGFALLILFFVFMHGSPHQITTITRVSPQSPAAHVGLRIGDIITSVGGNSVSYLDEMQPAVTKHLGKPLTFEIQRQGRHFVITLKPRRNPPAGQGPIGIELGKQQLVTYGPLESARLSAAELQSMAAAIPTALEHSSGLLTGSNSGGHVVGPIGIAHVTTLAVQQQPSDIFTSLLRLAALLSANLGVVNLLPFPALDGGRLVFVLVSAVRRRNLSPEVEGLIHLTGMAVLLFLIVLVSYQDLLRWLTGGSF